MTAPLHTRQGDTASAFFAKARRAWVDAMPPDKDLAVLEIGCGVGATGALALREGKCGSWIGIELSAREASEALFALTDVIGFDPAGQALPYKRASFGLIFVGATLGTFPKPARTLKAVVPLLRPGGRVIASVAGKGADRAAGFTAASLRRVLRRAGVTPLMVKAVGGKRGFLGLGRVPPQRIEAVGKR
ncbi:MAG: class I SAM-dependent methyltransferase [Caulobacteraceae bacterium]